MKTIVLSQWTNEQGTNQVTVTDETIAKLLTIDPDNYIADEPLDKQVVVPVPALLIDKMVRLQKFGYNAEEIDILDHEGLL